MIKKDKEKKRAIQLRRQGKTYSEILDEVKVARSTLSLWLQDVGLAEKQRHRITRKKKEAQEKATQSRVTERLRVTKNILEKAKSKVGKISKRELWLIGVALYWAEGSKQKTWNVSQNAQFTNSDPRMIALYLEWLRKSLGVNNNEISCWVAIHENHVGRKLEILEHWRRVTGLNKEISDRVYLKRHKPSSNRQNTEGKYFGSLKIAVKRSTNLNRQIEGWIRGICADCRIV